MKMMKTDIKKGRNINASPVKGRTEEENNAVKTKKYTKNEQGKDGGSEEIEEGVRSGELNEWMKE